MVNRTRACLTGVMVWTFLLGSAVADPCGLVPPIQFLPARQWAKGERPIERVGIQKTYVFYKNGLQTIVLRPAFTGKIDEFGMLIPFPSPPAIRKVPAKVFEHLANAIDPPEVVLDARRNRGGFGAGFGGLGGGMGGGGMGGGMGGGGGGLAYQVEQAAVRVIRREAIGMYEVAVLQAGSAKALKRWMTKRSFRYPDGMEDVCGQYIRQGWCFVAVKTKVKRRKASDPKPGQREIKNELPSDASFNGHVQAMGFRFRVRQPVVPMRLSVFNSDKLRNVVYLLADRSAMIQQLSTGFVVRQVPGRMLLRNLTGPLPLRVIGRVNRVTPQTRRRLKRDRDPRKHNGIAAELFSTDLAAAYSGQLLQGYEGLEKQLVEIGEELGLRGERYDQEMNNVLQRHRTRVARSTLRGLLSMTLTVIDGNFPRVTLARRNLTFRPYRMDPRRSTPQLYDAKKFGPAAKKKGVVYLGALLPAEELDEQIATIDPSRRSSVGSVTLACCFALALAAAAMLRSWPAKASYSNTWRRWMPWLPIVALLLIPKATLIGEEKAKANQVQKKPIDARERLRLSRLFRQLEDPLKASAAVQQIVRSPAKEEVVRGLILHVRSSKLTKRGWAIVGLGQVGGDKATKFLWNTFRNSRQPRLVRVWAAASLMKCTTDEQHFRDLTAYAQTESVLVRPLVTQLHAKAKKNPDKLGLIENLISVSRSSQTSMREVMSVGARPFLAVMLRSKSDDSRRLAAGLVATMGSGFKTTGYDNVVRELISATRFDPAAKKAPWDGGALFLPAISWQSHDAKKVVRNLVCWWCWGKKKGDTDAIWQVERTLSQSPTFRTTASFQMPKLILERSSWLKELKRIVSKKEFKAIEAQLAKVKK